MKITGTPAQVRAKLDEMIANQQRLTAVVEISNSDLQDFDKMLNRDNYNEGIDFVVPTNIDGIDVELQFRSAQ